MGAGKPAPSLLGGWVGHTERGQSHRQGLKLPLCLAFSSERPRPE